MEVRYKKRVSAQHQMAVSFRISDNLLAALLVPVIAALLHWWTM